MATRFMLGLCAIVSTSLLGACSYGVRSNPVLWLTDARVTDQQAALQVEIENTSDSDLTLTSIEYELTYGPLPVADGTWAGSRPIASGETINLPLAIGFDTPPIDPMAPTVELRGQMTFDDQGQSGALALTEATFDVSAPARR
ncbi:MAG: hypothetical protein AAGB51_04985 [Planctomycetota bacterium]